MPFFRRNYFFAFIIGLSPKTKSWTWEICARIHQTLKSYNQKSKSGICAISDLQTQLKEFTVTITCSQVQTSSTVREEKCKSSLRSVCLKKSDYQFAIRRRESNSGKKIRKRSPEMEFCHEVPSSRSQPENMCSSHFQAKEGNIPLRIAINCTVCMITNVWKWDISGQIFQIITACGDPLPIFGHSAPPVLLYCKSLRCIFKIKITLVSIHRSF